MDSVKTCSQSNPKFSQYHPVIPKLYTPAWKLDMKNRDRIVENCKLAHLPYQANDKALYLEKHERLNDAEPRDSIMKRCNIVPREILLKTPLHSALSKYESSLMFRSA